MLSEEYKSGVEENNYGYAYNPPGFELPYSILNLCKLDADSTVNICQSWINNQFLKCYNKATGLLDKNTEDPLTSTARLYELSQIPINFLDKITLDI